MLTSLIKRRSIKVFLGVVFFTLILAVAVALSPVRQASSQPCYEVEHEYYSDATYTNQVGYKYIYCGGTHSWGYVTQYKIVITGDCCGSCCDR
jgi:hypothetical protein